MNSWRQNCQVCFTNDVLCCAHAWIYSTLMPQLHHRYVVSLFLEMFSLFLEMFRVFLEMFRVFLEMISLLSVFYKAPLTRRYPSHYCHSVRRRETLKSACLLFLMAGLLACWSCFLLGTGMHGVHSYIHLLSLPLCFSLKCLCIFKIKQPFLCDKISEGPTLAGHQIVLYCVTVNIRFSCGISV